MHHGKLRDKDIGSSRSVVAAILLGLIRGYQLTISPVLQGIMGPRCGCRHYPSCSQYSMECIRRFGVLRGGILTVWRLLRCGPWSRGGIDPVPEEWNGTPRRTTIRRDDTALIGHEAGRRVMKTHG